MVALSAIRDAHGPPSTKFCRVTVRIDPGLMSSIQTAAELELAQLIVQCLNLDTVTAEQISPEAALFGSDLGLDSIDALEVALAVSKRYGVQLRADGEDNRSIFASLRSLSNYIAQSRPA